MSSSIVLNPGDTRISRLLADISKVFRVDQGRLRQWLETNALRLVNTTTTRQLISNDNEIFWPPDEAVDAWFNSIAALDTEVSDLQPLNHVNDEIIEPAVPNFQPLRTAIQDHPVEYQTNSSAIGQTDLPAATTALNTVTQHMQNLTSNHLQDLSTINAQPIVRKQAGQKRIRASDPALQNARQKRRKKCIQCEIDHKKCVPIDNGACERCVSFKSVISWCCYDTPDGIELFRVATPEFRLIPKLGLDSNILNSVPLPSERTSISIIISQGLTNLTLDVYKFDRTQIPIADLPQRQQNLYNVPFALKDMTEMEKRMQKFIKDSMVEYHNKIMHRSDDITGGFFRLAYEVAFLGAAKSALLSKALFLWTAARMMEGGWCIHGQQTLGLSCDENHQIEIVEAPLIDYQFAGILRDCILIPIRDQVLKGLQQKLHHKHKENWLEITLTNFILLNSYGHYIKQQKDIAAEWNLQRPYPCPKAFGEIFRGAVVLLTYWHKLKGQKVFDRLRLDYDRVSQELRDSGVEESQIKMLLAQAKRIDGKRPEWRELVKTNNYGEEHWFTGQMFQENWRPVEPSFPKTRAQE